MNDHMIQTYTSCAIANSVRNGAIQVDLYLSKRMTRTRKESILWKVEPMQVPGNFRKVEFLKEPKIFSKILLLS